MSAYKTLYVEGDIDKQIIDDFLENKKICNIRVYRIEADNEQICYGSYCRDEQLGAKQQIIQFIEHSNRDDTIDKNKYMGIVDADLDYCFEEIYEIDNLVYTDMNSMESYLININIFKKMCELYKIENSEFELFNNNFGNYINNFIDFNICFVTQVRNLTDFQENTLAFDDIPYCKPFIEQDNNFKFNIEAFKHKVKQNKEQWYLTYGALKNNFEELKNTCIDDIFKFLHGKYLLKYMISILKNLFSKVRTLSEVTIIGHLKDRFIILSEYERFNMFQKIEQFATI
jgi:hypothetical protein